MSNKIMSTKEFATKYGFAQSTVQRWCRKNHITSILINGSYRLVEDDVLKALGDEPVRKPRTAGKPELTQPTIDDIPE